jgi:hypothetical protein
MAWASPAPGRSLTANNQGSRADGRSATGFVIQFSQEEPEMSAQHHTGHEEWEVHATTYHRFMLGLKWFAIDAGALIAFLMLKFAMGVSFIGALFVGVVIFLAGAMAMRHGLAHSTEVNSDPDAPPA